MRSNSVEYCVLEHANITVTDPDALAEELCGLFDWHVRWAGEALSGGRTVHVGNDQIYLALYQPKTMSADEGELSAYQAQNGLNHIGLVVSDLDAMERRVVQAGYKPENYGDYEPGRRFYFSVAAGLEFELVSYG